MRRLAALAPVLVLLAEIAPAGAVSLPVPRLDDAPVAAGPGCVTGCGGASLSAYMGETIDLAQFSPDRTGATDTSAAWIAAIDLVNAKIAAGSPACIRAPAGIYLVARTLPTLLGAGCIVGEGRFQTFVKTAKTLSGPLFSWSDAWIGRNVNIAYPFNGPTMGITAQRAGPTLRNLTIVGDRTSQPQTAIAFFDHEDFALIEDVDVFYINGSAFSVGKTRHSTEAYMRESHIMNFRVWNSGSSTAPAVDFGPSGDTYINGIDIYAPYGVGMRIGSGSAGLHGNAIRIEGIEGNPTGIEGDLLQIGDPDTTGTSTPGEVHAIDLHALNLIDPYAGYAALHVMGRDSALLFGLDLDGNIGGGTAAGRGLQIDAGRFSTFRFRIGTSDTDLTIGANIGPQVVVDGYGAQGIWKIVNNSPQPGWVTIPALNAAPLSGGLDLETSRNATGQTASGKDSVALGSLSTASGANSIAIGRYNVASGTGATTLGNGNTVASDFGTASGQANTAGETSVAMGYRNTAQGPGSAVFGQNNTATGAGSSIVGFGGTDRGRPVWVGAGAGGVQYGKQIMMASATGTSETLLHGFQDSCPVIPANTVYGVKVALAARDATNNDAFAWTLPSAVMSRDSHSTIRVAAGTPASSGVGAGTNASARVGPAPAHGCLVVAFTPPPGNTHAWHVGATVETVEVQ